MAWTRKRTFVQIETLTGTFLVCVSVTACEFGLWLERQSYVSPR